MFLILAEALPEGMASGELAVATSSSPNTMSAHLAVLARAGLVRSDKLGRNVVYRAVTQAVEELSGLLAGACSTAPPVKVPDRDHPAALADGHPSAAEGRPAAGARGRPRSRPLRRNA